MPNEQPEMTQQTAGMKILDKKLEGFFYDRNYDFLAANELTVTIALAEYRKLVASDVKGTLEVEKREREITNLRRSLDATKAELAHVRELIAIKQPKQHEADDDEKD